MEKGLKEGILLFFATFGPKQRKLLNTLYFVFIFQFYFKHEVLYPEGRAAA